MSLMGRKLYYNNQSNCSYTDRRFIYNLGLKLRKRHGCPFHWLPITLWRVQYNYTVHIKVKGLSKCEPKQMTKVHRYRPLSRRLDRCDRVIQNESRDPFGGNVYYVTMQITFLTRKFRNGERNLHCDVVHITTKWVFRLTLDCNGVFAIKPYNCLARR